VELFIGAGAASRNSNHGSSSSGSSSKKCTMGDSTADDNGVGTDGDKAKKHNTGWHTDFQENFTIQLSGIKRWTLRRGRVRHPLRGTTPHYARDASVVENQLKVARLSCLGGNSSTEATASPEGIFNGSYGFEYGENNAHGPEQTITLHPGDVLYFPSGMWHRVETIEPGVSLNVSLMGTTYATLVCDALQHLLVGKEEGWREVVTSRPGVEDGAPGRLQGLLGGLSRLVDDFVRKEGGARSLLPPALCYPPLGGEEEGSLEGEGGGDIDEDCDSNEEENESSSDEGSGPMNGQMEGDSDDEEDGDAPSSGIIIPIDDFEGPSGWTCSRPPNATLVKNPLASLISMAEIAGHHHQPKSLNDTISNGDNHKKITKHYALNVNFAGNEMMESHIRVIFETANPRLMDQMDWYLECEARGHDPLQSSNNENGAGGGNDVAMLTPPLCLFYYGYFSWNDTA